MFSIEVGEPPQVLLAALAELHATWEAVRVSTARADRSLAEAGAALAYAAAGLPAPRRMIWCDSPLACVRSRRELGAAAGDNVRAAVVDKVARTVERSIDAAAPRAVRSRVWREARLPPTSPVSRAVQDAIEAGLRGERMPWPWTRQGGLLGWLRARSRRSQVREMAFSDAAFGQHDGPALSVYACYGAYAGLERETAPLRGLLQVARTTGWMVPHRAVCWLVERPDALRLDAQQRLHAPDGPALRFRDGWAHYAWKGVRVPPRLIEERHLISAVSINREHDPVLRRCMIDIMTPARYIQTSDAVCVSRDDAGELWLKSWHHWDSWAAVVVVNGTAEPDGTYRRYVLQVPPTMRSAREAVAWTYGLAEHEYAKLRLRT